MIISRSFALNSPVALFESGAEAAGSSRSDNPGIVMVKMPHVIIPSKEIQKESIPIRDLH